MEHPKIYKFLMILDRIDISELSSFKVNEIEELVFLCQDTSLTAGGDTKNTLI